MLCSENQVRIAVQFIDAATDRHLWAHSYERDLRDILALQKEVAQAIAQEIQIKLTAEEQTRMVSARPVHREAYDAYLKGRYFWHKGTEEGTKKSIEYFQQAIEKDPSYALAYVGLADSYLRLETYGAMHPSEIQPKARAAAVRAVELDDTLAEAHASLAAVRVRYDWDWAGAESAYQRAIALNPRYAQAHFGYGHLLAHMGRREASIAELKQARDLDPLSLPINARLASMFYYAGQYDAAIEQARQVMEMDPNFPGGHREQGMAYEQKGMYEEALRELQKAVNLSGGHRAVAALGHVYAASGKRKEAEAIINDLKTQAKHRYISPYFIAQVYAGLGEKEQAFEWLHRAYQERARDLLWLKVDPRLQGLHSDPRFADLLRHVGLPP